MFVVGAFLNGGTMFGITEDAKRAKPKSLLD